MCLIVSVYRVMYEEDACASHEERDRCSSPPPRRITRWQFAKTRPGREEKNSGFNLNLRRGDHGSWPEQAVGGCVKSLFMCFIFFVVVFC